MATWWHLLGVYVVAGGFAGIIAWRLLKTATPPGVAYVTFAIFAGVILLYLLIDTDRLADVPVLRLGNGLYRSEQGQRQGKKPPTHPLCGTEAVPPRADQGGASPGGARVPLCLNLCPVDSPQARSGL